MSWSVIGIFVLLVTWGFTKSMLFGILLLVLSCALQLGIMFMKQKSKYVTKPIHTQRKPRHEFLASETKRLQYLRESGLLTEDEFTVQNRLLSCHRPNTFIQS